MKTFFPLLALLCALAAPAAADAQSFRLYGKPIDLGDPENAPYKKALKRYPSLEKCLAAGFRPERHHLTAMRALYASREEFLACHYWYFSSFERPKENIVAFLEANDLRFEVIEKELTGSAKQGRPGYAIIAYWSVLDYPVPFAGNPYLKDLLIPPWFFGVFKIHLSRNGEIAHLTIYYD
ncbi:MAG: hypothetical protein AAGE89_05060 [Pseudomonadota bacterium]